LLQLVAAGKLSLRGIITHRYGLDEIQDAYDVFADAATTGALKVVLYGDQACCATLSDPWNGVA